jgi:hypothetical protein
MGTLLATDTVAADSDKAVVGAGSFKAIAGAPDVVAAVAVAA